ncbi:MAG: hypothetical protein QG650_313 [Patescibacteria group bacterium]|nr:hypothetical protein [Patescibacteria group bacterium]
MTTLDSGRSGSDSDESVGNSETSSAIKVKVSSGVSETLSSDSSLSDVFLPDGEGGFSINPKNRILSGHFPEMPIVPGVIAKRLLSTLTDADPYHLQDVAEDRLAWHTEFVSVITPKTSNIRICQDADGHSLKSGDKTLVRISLKPARLTDVEAERPIDLRSHHLKDLFQSSIESIERENVDRFLLQSDPFRFVTAGGSLEGSEVPKPKILGGFFNVPEEFVHFSPSRTVPMEIIEESVAQIFSFAYAKTRGLPEVILADTGEINPKARILTFKSSVSEAGSSELFEHDQLFVAMEILSESDNGVSIAYEAWNCIRRDVLRGTIEAGIVPVRLLKRIAG